MTAPIDPGPPLKLTPQEQKISDELKAYNAFLTKNKHPVVKNKHAYLIQYHCEETDEILGFFVTDQLDMVTFVLGMCQARDPRTPEKVH